MKEIGKKIKGKRLTFITSGIVITETNAIAATVIVADDTIEAIVPKEVTLSQLIERYVTDEQCSTLHIDAKGSYILPGMIDIHCDAIEKEVEPRPNTIFPLEMALLEFERKLPMFGITTMYHSLSLGVGLSLRGYHIVKELIELIHRNNQKRRIVRNQIHLRFEVSYHDGLAYVEQFIEQGLIHYLSYMDHSPGQGQYRAEGSFERYVMKNQGVTKDEVKAIIDDLLARRKDIDWDYLSALAQRAKKRGIPVASHDDDTEEKVNQALKSGITISEFPIHLSVAGYAIANGLDVCVGAPNIVRGGSHDHNMRAVDAIMDAGATIVCSDYYPAAMLHAIFKMYNEFALPIHEAVKLTTLHPAKAMGIDEQFGSIAEGKKADIIIVDQFHSMPFVKQTMIDGVIVYTSEPHFES